MMSNIIDRPEPEDFGIKTNKMKIERPIKELHYDEDAGGNKIFDSFWYIESLENYANQLESQLKEVKELLYKSKHNSQMSISEFEQFLYDRDKYLTQNKQDES